ncbi:hypothetical protein [Bacillus sp. V5-8f]|uniref:hypothetical protein n=1 Tax=Bacillus sp. V5-8f TaxID=2053044 RepID=UPI00267C4EC9|nr:hypothetical protein [Bacillus sp. V5-8f]
MNYSYRISVRSFVEYVYRSGSLDTRYYMNNSMAEGTKVHQKIQKQYREKDQNECFLKTDLEYKDITFQIEGRCDGLLFDEGTVTVDEIKSNQKS